MSYREMLPSPLRHSLYVLQAVAVATLLRSIAYERWITVVTALALLIGAAASLRGKTWGIGLTLGAAVAFPAAWAIGIAPAWFCFVGVTGVLPFVLTSRSLTRFDAAATTLGAVLAVVTGVLGAVAWRGAAPFLFKHIPALAPTSHASGAALIMATALAAGTISILSTRRSSSKGYTGSVPLTPLRAPAAGPIERSSSCSRVDEPVEVEDGDDAALNRPRAAVARTH